MKKMKKDQRVSFFEILNSYDKIIIPDVQRDYVMGSGGKKLKAFLDAIDNRMKEEQCFYGSSLIGTEVVENGKHILYVYDGQQRLATLICLCLFRGTGSEDIKKMCKKFEFQGRSLANKWIQEYEENGFKLEEAEDFTTYSMANLYQKCKNWKIDLNRILNKVCFDLVLVEKVSEAEQFYLDINDGLDLKEYEIFKAELYHHAKAVIGDGVVFKNFALSMENEWLDFFASYVSYASYGCGEEEKKLIAFLKYCFRMMWIEENGCDDGYQENDVSWLIEEHFKRITEILNGVVETRCNDIKINYARKVYPWINYSCEFYSDEKRWVESGQCWNIKDSNDSHYKEMLSVFLHSVEEKNEIRYDVLIWCYLTHLKDETLDKYLRLIKKLLNHIRMESKEAKFLHGFYYCDRKGEKVKARYIKENPDRYKWTYQGERIYPGARILYSRYYTFGIPSYYLSNTYGQENDKDIDARQDNKDIIKENTEKLFDVILFNKQWKQITINACRKEWIRKELYKYISPDIESITVLENLSFLNGVVDNFLDYTQDSCKLKEWVKKKGIESLQKLEGKNSYTDVLDYVYENDVSMKCWKINISWNTYTKDSKPISRERYIAPHTLSDLFTDQEIEFGSKPVWDLREYYDGWLGKEIECIEWGSEYRDNEIVCRDFFKTGKAYLSYPKDSTRKGQTNKFASTGYVDSQCIYIVSQELL